MEKTHNSDKEIVCRFEKKKKPLTVGDVFELHCEWPLSILLSSPVRIEFDQINSAKNLNKKNTGDHTIQGEQKEQSPPGPYSLVILKTINIYPGKGVFKVTSYKPGNYNTGFHLVSDQGIAGVKQLSWKVESVIPPERKETIKPYPPYGPWIEVLPFWHWPLSGVVLLSLLVFIVFKTRLFIKRKKKIQEVNNRLKNKTPFREFVSQLNLLVRQVNSKESKSIIQKLDIRFRFFLENEFLIFALNTEPKKIAQQLKKYYPSVYEKCNILGFFTEIDKLSREKTGSKEYEQILDMARELAISCVEQEQQ